MIGRQTQIKLFNKDHKTETVKGLLLDISYVYVSLDLTITLWFYTTLGLVLLKDDEVQQDSLNIPLCLLEVPLADLLKKDTQHGILFLRQHWLVSQIQISNSSKHCTP